MSNKKTKKANKVPAVELTPVQIIENVLIENGLLIRCRVFHKQPWRVKLIGFISNILKVQVVPTVVKAADLTLK